MKTTVKRKLRKKFESFKNDLLGDYHTMIRDKRPYQYLLDRNKAMFEHEDYKALKSFERAYIEGMRTAQLSCAYAHLIWGFVYNGEYTEKLPYGPDFNQDLIEKSYHHYKGHPDRPF